MNPIEPKETKLRCPVCESVFNKENTLLIYEIRESAAGLNYVVTVGCEDCGFFGEFKVAKDLLGDLLKKGE